MLRIERVETSVVLFTVSGRLTLPDIPIIRRLLDEETGSKHVALDLRDLMLVDEEAIRFLQGCEYQSFELKSCPAFIREWIDRTGKNG